jgi:hypothetical protein
MPRRRTAVGIAAGATALAATALTPLSAQAAGPVMDRGALIALNDSGVSGQVTVVNEGGQLRVSLAAVGVEGMQVHLSHIHGFGDGAQASCPDASLAGDDGILTFEEGLPAYGPVVVGLGDDTTRGSQLVYSRTFTETAAGDPVSSMGAIDQYVIVVHGMTVNGTYEQTLPVACAVLS